MVWAVSPKACNLSDAPSKTLVFAPPAMISIKELNDTRKQKRKKTIPHPTVDIRITMALTSELNDTLKFKTIPPIPVIIKGSWQ